MSEFVQGALIAGGFALAGALVTQIFNLFLERRREDASYRINLYDKRLAVHQQAFEWLMKLARPLTAVTNAEPRVAAQGRERVKSLCEEALTWHDANCLYLDPDSQDKMKTFIMESHTWALNPAYEPPEGDPWSLFTEAYTAVQAGIGMRHIDPRILPEEPHDD